MIELLKILADNLLKILSPENIAKAQKNKKLKDIGVEIFLLYSSLNNILVCGKEIIKELEGALPWMKRKVENDEINRIYGNKISSLLKNQLAQLNQFVRSYERLQNQLELLSPDFKLNLYPIIGEKVNALSILARCISGEIGQNTQLISMNEKGIIKLMKNHQRLDEITTAERLMVIDHGITDVDNLIAGSYNIIKRYLDSQIPYERLDEIEILANKLNQLIKDNFAVEDILIAVADKKLLPKMPSGVYYGGEFDKYK